MIGLGLICKNEELVIANCLNSHLPYVDAICLIDTGSSDSTLQIATSILRESQKPFHIEVHAIRPFNFSKARNIYVDFFNDKVDWILAADADDVLPKETGEALKPWVAAGYDVFSLNYQTGPACSHVHHRLFRTKMGIRYEGAVHEYLKIGDSRYCHLNLSVIHKPLEPDHYEKSAQRNAEIIASISNPTPRDIFYKAQTHKDRGEFKEAIEAYDIYLRSSSNYLDERLMAYWYKSYLERISGDTPKAIQTANEGLALDPSFAELLMELAYCTEDKSKRYEYALKANAIPFRSRLFNLEGNYKDGAYVKAMLEGCL